MWVEGWCVGVEWVWFWMGYTRGLGGRARGRMVHTDVGGVNRSQGV